MLRRHECQAWDQGLSRKHILDAIEGSLKSAPAAPSSSTTPSPPLTKGLDAGLKARLKDLTREYRWGDDIR